MVTSALVVSFIATTTLVAGSAMPITIRKGTIVQAISTVTLSWKLAGLRAARLAVLEHRIEHHAEHADEDQRADDQHEVVQPDLLGRDPRHRRMEIDLVDRRPAGQVVHRERSAGGECRTEEQCGLHGPLNRRRPKCLRRLHREVNCWRGHMPSAPARPARSCRAFADSKALHAHDRRGKLRDLTARCQQRIRSCSFRCAPSPAWRPATPRCARRRGREAPG